MHEKQAKMAQTIAILEQRLREHEYRNQTDSPSGVSEVTDLESSERA